MTFRIGSMSRTPTTASRTTLAQPDNLLTKRRSLYDILVIGAGPAGCVTALEAAHSGRHVALVARAETDDEKIGETVPPSIRPLLDRLGLWQDFLKEGFLPSYANRSAWGSDQVVEHNFMNDPYGHGWHLDRRRFDRMLLTAAQRAGADVLPETSVAGCSDQGSTWLLRLRGPGGDASISARWAVDATGRASWFARQVGATRQADDKLIASAGFFGRPASRFEDTTTLVEATPDGWWYSAPLPDGRLVAAYFTDPDLADAEVLTSPEPWRRLMAAAPATDKRVTSHGGSLPGTLRVLSAGSSRLQAFTGKNWLAAGDAALCYDPLSSGGIAAAMGGGIDAAEAIGKAIEGESDAMDQYAARLDRAYDRYLRLLAAYYRDEKRWADRPFWKRRSSRPIFGEAPAA